MAKKITIGTRASKLALKQAKQVQHFLSQQGFAVQIKKITTQGDKIQDRPLVDIGGKGLFLKEIEEELLTHKIDMAVHSLKDMPFELPQGLMIGAVLKRNDPHDAFLSREHQKIAQMNLGAVIGTSSLRRKIQLQKKFPNLIFKDLRGNVETRLRKMQNGDYDGIVLAAAGLKRLGLEKHISEILDIIPAVGQGAIAIECREEDSVILQILKSLHDEETGFCVGLEREFLKIVQGDCQTPIGCLVTTDPCQADKFNMRWFLADPRGENCLEKTISGLRNEAQKILLNFFK